MPTSATQTNDTPKTSGATASTPPASTPAMSEMSATQSCTGESSKAVSAMPSTTGVLELVDGCCLWSCPLDAVNHESSSEQCCICLQYVAPKSLLACAQCHQSGCVQCHLRNLSVRKYASRQEAYDRKAACFFCRAQYPMLQLQQLELVYRAHKQHMPFSLWSPANGALARNNSSLIHIITASIDDHGIINMTLIQTALGIGGSVSADGAYSVLHYALIGLLFLTGSLPLTVALVISPAFRCVFGVLVAFLLLFFIVDASISGDSREQHTQTDFPDDSLLTVDNDYHEPTDSIQ